jgi:hypothetical protein
MTALAPMARSHLGAAGVFHRALVGEAVCHRGQVGQGLVEVEDDDEWALRYGRARAVRLSGGVLKPRRGRGSPSPE